MTVDGHLVVFSIFHNTPVRGMALGDRSVNSITPKSRTYMDWPSLANLTSITLLRPSPRRPALGFSLFFKNYCCSPLSGSMFKMPVGACSSRSLVRGAGHLQIWLQTNLAGWNPAIFWKYGLEEIVEGTSHPQLPVNICIHCRYFKLEMTGLFPYAKRGPSEATSCPQKGLLC